MALVIPPTFGQASWELKNSGDPESWFITCGFDLSAGTYPYEDNLTTISGEFLVNILPGFSTTTAFVGTHLAIGQDGGPPLRVFKAQSQSGSSGSDKLPQNCALLVTKTTSRPGRPGKGRMYLPNYINEGEVDNVGNIDGTERAAFQTLFDDFYDALIAGVAGESSPPVLLHNEGVPGGTTPTPINSFSVQPVIATQRRRLRR